MAQFLSMGHHMRQRRAIPALLFAAVLAFTGCRSGNPNLPDSKATATHHDDLQTAVKHYQIEDLPESDILKMFQQIAEKGDARGTMWLARFYLLGQCSLPQRSDLAQKMAKDVIADVVRRAKRGDPEAEFLLAFAYHMGLGVDQDLAMAVKWYAKAADAEELSAINNLAVMLARGHGTEPDILRARLLFSRAADLGAPSAARNLITFGETGRDDTARLKALRTLLLVRALGMQKDKGIAFLTANGLISDPTQGQKSEHNGREQYLFRADGIVLDVDVNGRIMNVEGHAKGSRGCDQFRGGLPFGLAWDNPAVTARQMPGAPDDSGYMASDQAFGFAYDIGNVCFVALFSYEGAGTLKLWRVYERWAVRYADP